MLFWLRMSSTSRFLKTWRFRLSRTTFYNLSRQSSQSFSMTKSLDSERMTSWLLISPPQFPLSSLKRVRVSWDKTRLALEFTSSIGAVSKPTGEKMKRCCFLLKREATLATLVSFSRSEISTSTCLLSQALRMRSRCLVFRIDTSVRSLIGSLSLKRFFRLEPWEDITILES